MGLVALELIPRSSAAWIFLSRMPLELDELKTGQDAMGRGGERASDLLNSTLKIISH